MGRPRQSQSGARAALLGLPEILSLAAALERGTADRLARLQARLVKGHDAEPDEALRRLASEANQRAERLARDALSMGVQAPWTEAEVLEACPDVAPPSDLDDAIGQSLYRALAWAVENQQWAFRLFSYLAAHIRDSVARQWAEDMARDRLSQAARLRSERRRAFHEDRKAGRLGIQDLAAKVGSSGDLRVAAVLLEQAIATQLSADAGEGAQEALRQSRFLVAELGPTVEEGGPLLRDAENLLDPGRGVDAAQVSLDRAFCFYDAVLRRAPDEETFLLAQRMAQACLDRMNRLQSATGARIDAARDA